MLSCQVSALDDAALAKQIEAHVVELASSDRFSGAVMVAREGKVIYQGAWGLASRSFQAPNRVDTKFNLGSMNKMFPPAPWVSTRETSGRGRVALPP